MRKYLPHILIISFAFFLTPTAQAASYEAEKRYEAEKELGDAKEEVRRNPDDAMAYASLGIAYHNVHKTKEAIKTLKQAIRMDPDNRYGYSYLARVYGETGEYKKAIKLREKMLNNDPYDQLNIIQLGFDYVIIGDKDSAFEMYKRLKKLNNHNAAKTMLKAIDEGLNL